VSGPRTSAGTAPGAGERILVTGATGFLGRQIMRALLDRFPAATLRLLIRPKGSRCAEERAQELLRRVGADTASALDSSRVEALSGDVSLPRCGLAAERYARVVGDTTRVVHAAASVRFDLPLNAARAINVEGARNILALAEDAHAGGALRSLVYVSTAYVAGERAGLVLEDELDMGQGFRNSYEKTKCEAEKLVRARAGALPVAILRPSIIVGDSQTGITTSFKTLYWPLKAYARWHWRLVPGLPDTVVDVVPVDFVAQAVARLALDEAAVGKSAHLCAGLKGSLRLDDMTRLVGDFFRLPPPRLVNPTLFTALIRPLLFLSAWGAKRRVLREGWIYRPYLRMRLVFDTRNADALLARHNLRPPHVSDYLERILRYCVESDWGRAPVPVERQQN